MSTENKKNFLFGIGCEKGGSTWLHDYLAGLDDAAMSEPKEFHVFNGTMMPKEHGGSFRIRLGKFLKEIDGVPAHKIFKDKIGEELIRVLHMYYDYNVYVDFFRRVAEPESVKLVGEITPSYALLSPENLNTIKELLDPYFNIKLVFFMRDPVERAFSLLRMKRRNALKEGKNIQESENKTFQRLYKSPIAHNPGQYEKIIEKVEALYSPEQIYYGFYETQFEKPEIEKLCNFLGVGFKQPDFERKLNVSKQAESLSEDSIAMAREHYAPTYDFCADRFGKDFISKIWPHF